LFAHELYDGLGDSEVLRRFVETRDEGAFSCLVRRHGPMVFGLARRIVRDHQLAEDIFQATFLVLARSPRAVRGRDRLPAWLHSVAFRLAVRAKKAQRRLAETDAGLATLGAPDPLDELSAREFLTILDAELNNLPETYRLPLILCHLEGLSREQAAKRLGLNVNVVKGRLERGRLRLQARLAKRGLAVGIGLAVPLEWGQAAAPVSPILVQSTLKAALAGQGASATATQMAKGVIHMILLAKARTVCMAALLLCTAGWGAGWVAVTANSAQQLEIAAVAPVPAFKAVATDEPQDKRVDLYGDPLPDGVAMRLGTVQLRAPGAHLALTADDKTLIGIRAGKYVTFWDVESGKLKEAKELPTTAGSDGGISPDGKWYIATKSGGLRVFDLQNWKPAYELPATGSAAIDPWWSGFSKDGRYLAAGFRMGDTLQIRAWDLITRKLIFDDDVEYKQQFFQIVTYHFTPDAKKLLVSFTNTGLTICLDIASRKRVWETQRFAPFRETIAFTGDGKILSARAAVDVATGELLKPAKLPIVDSLGNLAALPDGRTLLVSSPKGVIVWDVEAGKELRTLEGAGEEMVLAHDGKTVITNSGGLQRWDIATGKPLYADNFGQGHTQEVIAMVFSANGKRMVSGSGDGSVRLWDMNQGQPIHVWPGQEAYRPFNITRWENAGVQAVSLTPDARWVVSTGSDKQLRGWDGATGQVGVAVAFPPLPQGELEPRIYNLRIAPDGGIATAFYGATAFVGKVGAPPTPHHDWEVAWDLKKGTLVSKAALERRVGVGAAFSRDGKLSVSVGNVVDVVTGKEVSRLEVAGGRAGQPAEFSSDSALIAGAATLKGKNKQENVVYPDGFRVWEKASGLPVAELKIKWNSGKILFHPSGRFLIVSGIEGIQVWDIDDGKMVANPPLPERIRARTNGNTFTSCLALTPDGKYLAGGLTDGSIVVWKMDLPAAKPSRLSAKEFESLWAELKNTDAAKAWRAVWRLADSPDDALPLLRGRLKAVPPTAAEITGPLLADLASDVFAKRNAASSRLKELGIYAESALREHLQTNPSLEARQRIEAILKAIGETPLSLTPEEFRDIRAVAVLARIPSPTAREILESLAKGVSSAPLTLAAKAALAAR
jgi:RNA polymerase sigma factor (sigma-70 family)